MPEKNIKKITILEVDLKKNEEALELLEELSDSLEAITGNNGKASFRLEDMQEPRSVFVIAKDCDGKAVGCGAIRSITGDIAEVKRMYARVIGKGVGTEILSFLEMRAKGLGYTTLWLETRRINGNAVRFYERNGYLIRENYGKYIGNIEAVCFEKRLDSSLR